MVQVSYIVPMSSPSDIFQKPKKLENIASASTFIPSPFSPPSTPGVYAAPIPIFDIKFAKPFYPASGMGTLGSRTFYSRHRPDVLGPNHTSELRKPDSTNVQEYDRDFYDRFGHSQDMNDYVSMDNGLASATSQKKDEVKKPVETKIRAEIVVATETKAEIKVNKNNSEVKEADIDYEKILGLTPLPVRLRYIKTTSPHFNFNDPSFDLFELAEIRRREVMIENLKTEMKAASRA